MHSPISPVLPLPTTAACNLIKRRNWGVMGAVDLWVTCQEVTSHRD